MRQVRDLVEVDDPAWPEIAHTIRASGDRVQGWPAGEPLRTSTLGHLQVTLRSALGAFVWHCGGLFVSHGWLRVYGSPGADLRLPSLAGVNGFEAAGDPWRPGGALVVAHDVLGGVFAVNGVDPAGGGRPGEPGEIVYFAPDSLVWEPLSMGHGAWLDWLMTDGLDEFYADLRWPGWEHDVASLPGSVGISVMPFLWSAEAQENLAATTRQPVPLAELLGLHLEFCQQLGTGHPGFLGVVEAS